MHSFSVYDRRETCISYRPVAVCASARVGYDHLSLTSPFRVSHAPGTTSGHSERACATNVGLLFYLSETVAYQARDERLEAETVERQHGAIGIF
jgi:hypothetical protein